MTKFPVVGLKDQHLVWKKKNNDSRPKSYFKIDRVWRKGHIIILWRSTTQRGPPGGQYEPPTTHGDRLVANMSQEPLQGTAAASAASASHPPGAGAEIYFPAGINQGLAAASTVPPVVCLLPWWYKYLRYPLWQVVVVAVAWFLSLWNVFARIIQSFNLFASRAFECQFTQIRPTGNRRLWGDFLQ